MLSRTIGRIAKARSVGPSRPTAVDGPSRPTAVDERPGCTYGAVTRQKVSDLGQQVGRIETKVNAILGGVILAVILEAIRSLSL